MIEYENTGFGCQSLGWLKMRYCYKPENLGTIQKKWQHFSFTENVNLHFKAFCTGTSSDVQPAFVLELQRLFPLLKEFILESLQVFSVNLSEFISPVCLNLAFQMRYEIKSRKNLFLILQEFSVLDQFHGLS